MIKELNLLKLSLQLLHRRLLLKLVSVLVAILEKLLYMVEWNGYKFL